MPRFLGLVILSALTLPAFAEEPPKEDAPRAHHARVTWEQHFTQANVAHDGHLTLEEAKGGYTLVAKHFSDIDVDGKGYVTENDIRAWRAMRKAAHRLTQPAGDALKPRNVIQLGPVERKSFTASATQTVAIPADPPPAQAEDAPKD